MKLILLSGCLRSGKNSFADAIQKELENLGKSVARLSFAQALKEDCAFEIREKYNLDSFSQKTEEKNIFRHILIRRATENRARTNNSYYADIIKKKLQNISADYVIIDDLRHAESEGDELSLTKLYKSLVVFISPKWDVQMPDSEKISLPKVEKEADWVVKWPRCPAEIPFSQFVKPYIRSFMRYFNRVELFFEL